MMEAFFLDEFDRRLERTGLFFVRFMDDIVVLAPTRWKLLRAVREVSEVLGGLQQEKHIDKSFIGRVEPGFDFLGYRLAPGRMTVAEATRGRFVERALRLYEQERGAAGGCPRLGAYARRWLRWAAAGDCSKKEEGSD